MNFKKFLPILAFSLILLAACTPASPEAQNPDNADKIKIVTTFAPLYSFATNVAGDLAEVTNLVPTGVSEHVWEPTSSDLRALAEADLLVMNGLNLERFVPDMVDAAQNSKLVVLDTSAAIPSAELLASPELVVLEEAGAEEEEINPHVWLSPKLAIFQIQSIRDALAKIDPEHAETFEQNAQAYIAQLSPLDEEIREAFTRAHPKDFIVFHDAYTYYLGDYGLTDHMRAAIEPFPGKEPTAVYFKNLIELIEQQGVSLVFTEPQFSPRMVQNLKTETGVQSFELDPVGPVSVEGYEENLRNLTQALVEAFGD